jgi:hypothetical protein
MTSDAEWTGRWVAEKITGHDEVASVELIAANRVKVFRTKFPTVIVGTGAASRLDAEELAAILRDDPKVDFVVNVPKEAFVTGDALALAVQNGVTIGGLGDLMRAIENADVSTYVSPEVAFIERGLRQHSRVVDFERVDDRRYVIERRGLRTLTVVFLGEYELTADHVRVAQERYERFDFLVATNPNGRPTTASLEAAQSMGAKVLKWGPFLGALNRR